MVLRALAVLAPLGSCALRIGSRTFQQAVATLVGVVVLSLGASTAWGLGTVNFGWHQFDPSLGFAPRGNPQDLTYYFGTPTADLPMEVQHNTLEAALGVWSSVTAVTFSETALAHQPRSIDINFCPFSTCFPGEPSNVLALTFLPPDVAPIEIGTLSGDIFFNDDFRWEVGNDLGCAAFDLTYVGVHESGHSLGLLHSDNPNSVMFPFVGCNQTFVGLNQEEISAVQFLYGP